MTTDERDTAAKRYNEAHAALFRLEQSLGPLGVDVRRQVFAVRVQLGNLDIARRLARTEVDT